jgi:hypothetical protein
MYIQPTVPLQRSYVSYFTVRYLVALEGGEGQRPHGRTAKQRDELASS